MSRFQAILVVTFASMVVGASARADMTATFEDVTTGVDGVAIDFRPTDAFSSGGFTFSNHYVPPDGIFAGYYSGFGVSTQIDNTPVNDPFGSSDYDHKMGAYAPQPMGGAGTGSGGSASYAVAFNHVLGDAVIDAPVGYDFASIDVANTTYAASTILYGDAYSREFQPGDYFRLEIIGFDGAGATGAQVASVTTTLAEWPSNGSRLLPYGFRTVDLTSLAGSRSLGFLITTNVTNDFGPSIAPTFAVDNVVGIAAVPEPSGLALGVIGLVGLGVASARRRRKNAA